MKKIFVKTNSKNTPGYLTAGKIYECETVDGVSGYIYANNGGRTFIYIPACSHIGEDAWTVVTKP